jgi:peptidyl-prolyl cis-trans isomerase SurA
MNIRSPFAVFLIVITALQLPIFAHARSTNPVEVDRIVAVVNDEVITMQELQSRLASIERQMREQNVPLPPKNVIERQMLDRMIFDRVQLQEAKESGRVA